MRTLTKVAGLTGLTSLAMFAALPALAQEHIGPTEQQSTNWTAIGMFGSFVLLTLFITRWASSRTKSAADFNDGHTAVTF